MEDFGRHGQLFSLLVMGLRPGMIGTLMPCIAAKCGRSRNISGFENIWVVMYSAPASTFALRYMRSVSRLGGFEMLFGVAGDADAEVCFTAVLDIFFQVDALV